MSATSASRYFISASVADSLQQKAQMPVPDICAFCASLWLKLHRDRAAGDTCARVSRRIGLHVVSFLVNDERRAAIREKPIRPIAQHYAHVSQRLVRCSFRAHREIKHVAGMWPFRILQTMHFAVRVEMWTSRFEARPFTFSHLMNVY